MHFPRGRVGFRALQKLQNARNIKWCLLTQKIHNFVICNLLPLSNYNLLESTLFCVTTCLIISNKIFCIAMSTWLGYQEGLCLRIDNSYICKVCCRTGEEIGWITASCYKAHCTPTDVISLQRFWTIYTQRSSWF